MNFELEVKVNSARRKPVLLVYYHNRVLIEFPEEKDNTPENIKKIIDSNKDWIEAKMKLNKTSSLEIYDKTYDFVSGTLIFLKGDRYKLKVVLVKDSLQESVFIEGKEIVCRVCNRDPKNIRKKLKDFIFPKSEEIFKEKTVSWGLKLGVSFDKVFLKEYKTSWAHVRDNDIYYDWRAYFLGEKFINYLVVHELLHFMHRNHCEEFLEKLGRLIPNYLDVEKELKELRYVVYRF